MANQTIKIECTGLFTLNYDSSTKEFKEALESYNKVINPEGDEESMLLHVAHNLRRYGRETMVEGVGYVHMNRMIAYDKKNQPWSGIFVEDDDPDFDYSVY